MMLATNHAPAPVEAPAAPDAARKQIRGSGLLLTGRLLTLGLNFLTQVLIVRYLSTSDFGAWAYALSLVALLQSVASLGLDRAVTRFVPIYHEQKRHDKLFGTIGLMVASVLLVALVIVGALHAMPEQFLRLLNDRQEQPLALLFILIFLVPVEALDTFLVGLFACFSKSRAIFFRRYVLGPGLKLTVVLMLVLLGGGVTFLAYGYLLSALLAVLIYSGLLVRLFRQQGLLEDFSVARIAVPVRELLSFTLPLMTSEAVAALVHGSGVLLLGYFYGLDEVALFRVVVPAAMLNLVVMRSFSMLYTPTAARLFAKDDHAGINDLYWRTAVWMAVLTFPIFAVTFCAARPLTVFLYGARYESAGLLLSVLAVGHYVNVALGFNALTLKIVGRVRYVVTINLLAAAADIAISLALIPRFGALGAAVAAAGTMIVHNIFKQAGLRLAMGISLFDSNYSSVYLNIALGIAALLFVRVFAPGDLLLVLSLAGAASLLLIVLTKRSLRVAETFPELVRLPLMRALLT